MKTRTDLELFTPVYESNMFMGTTVYDYGHIVALTSQATKFGSGTFGAFYFDRNDNFRFAGFHKSDDDALRGIRAAMLNN